MESNIVIHHVGGRAGSMSFNIPPYFRNDFTVVLYEPDKDAIKRIEEYSQANYTEHYVLPFCLDSKISTKILHINRDPNTSSLLKQNPKYAEYYYFQGGHRNYDYVWGETSETIIETEVNTTTLDTVIETKNIPSPDIFCIDTQGSEYNILEGSEKALLKTLVVIAEVEFSPLYANQPLFGDIANLLKKRGFDFVYFNNLNEMSPTTTSITSRGKGCHIYSDALFIKSVEQIEIDFPDEKERKLAIIKLAFFLICSGHTEIAISLMQKTDAINFLNKDSIISNRDYIKFCTEFYSLVNSNNQEKNIMPTFAATFSLDESMQRINSKVKNIQNNNSDHANSILKNILKQVKPLVFVVHFFKHHISYIAERIFILSNSRNSDVEKFFINFGLHNTAKIVKKNRLECALGLYRNR